MFDCGIHTTMQELSNQIRKEQENFIVSAVQELYVDNDKEKLEKCLNNMYAKLNGIEMDGDEDEDS